MRAASRRAARTARIRPANVQLEAPHGRTTGTAAVETKSPPSHGGGGQSVDCRLQAAVVADQKTVDAGLTQITSDLSAVKTACAALSTVTFTAISDASGVIHGTVTGASGLPVSIPSDTDAAGNAIPATTVASDGTFTFGSSAPLRSNASYTVQLGDDTSGVTVVDDLPGGSYDGSAGRAVPRPAAEHKLASGRAEP